MADSARNRSSEGVHTSVFPRTDFPQQGWIRKPTVNGTVNDFYEAIKGFGWFSQTQSFRSNEHQISYGARIRSLVRPFYQTEPQQGWIRKPTVNGATNDLYEAITDFGWYGRTNSDVPPIRKSRMLDQWPFDDTAVDISQVFNPATADWGIDTALASKKIRRYSVDQPNTDWIGNVASGSLFDPSIIGGILEQTADTRRWILQQLSLNVGIKSDGAAGPPPPVPFDPAVLGWTIDSGRTPNRKGLPESYLAPQRGAFQVVNTQVLAAVWAQTLNDDAMAKGRIYLRPRQEQPAQDWIYTSIPPFNVQFVIHSEMPLRMAAGKWFILQHGHYLNDLSWLKDVLGLVDLPPTATHHKRPIAPIMSARRRNRRR